MSWNPNNDRNHRARLEGEFPDAPRYDGPTNAEQFVDDICGRAALKRLDLPVPPQLRYENIVGRYAFTNAERGDDGRPNRFYFMDGSIARKNRRGRWVTL